MVDERRVKRKWAGGKGRGGWGGRGGGGGEEKQGEWPGCPRWHGGTAGSQQHPGVKAAPMTDASSSQNFRFTAHANVAGFPRFRKFNNLMNSRVQGKK